jgi:uncharacterized protein (TIGR03032 family)
VLDSGRGFLIRIDPDTGTSDDVAFCPGFLRGLSFHRGYAVVTSSLPRDEIFSGLQLDANLAARGGEPRCGIFVVNLRHGDIVEWIRIDGHIRELFDVIVLPDVQCPMSDVHWAGGAGVAEHDHIRVGFRTSYTWRRRAVIGAAPE